MLMTPRERMDDEQGEEHIVQEQHMLILPPGSIYSDEEVRVLDPWQRLRQRFLGPIAVLLARLGLSADMLSFASVLFGLGFFLLAPVQFAVAFWLLVASIVLDGLDGVEARLTKTNTARGSFTDMFCDEVVVAFSVGGLAWKGLIHPVLAVLFVYVYTALVTFLVLHRMLKISSAGIVRPSRMLLYVAIALYFIFHIDLLNYLLIFYTLALPLVFLSFWRLRKAL
jgi:phosphatidylglycerophosphate synthase